MQFPRSHNVQFITGKVSPRRFFLNHTKKRAVLISATIAQPVAMFVSTTQLADANASYPKRFIPQTWSFCCCGCCLGNLRRPHSVSFTSEMRKVWYLFCIEHPLNNRQCYINPICFSTLQNCVGFMNCLNRSNVNNRVLCVFVTNLCLYFLFY